MKDELAQLERELIEKAQDKLHAKLEDGTFNGDVEENMLLVLFSINRRVGRICANPMIILGDFFQKYPKLASVVGMVTWVLMGAGSLLAIMAFLNAMGWQLHVNP